MVDIGALLDEDLELVAFNEQFDNVEQEH